MLLRFSNLLTEGNRRMQYMNLYFSTLSVFLPLGFKSSIIFLFNLRRTRKLFRKKKRMLKMEQLEQVTKCTMTFGFFSF